ncbi:caspase family protein [Nonomuraea sp. NPDC049750]|uniref:caspase, EACC1-associated type n=1 Tax=Nonomuraea sp. NPDC049750 TaxID=3154738 RepID=UPI0033FA20B7
MTTRPPDPFDRSDSRAVLIGVGGYDDPGFPPVPAALNSLEAMRRVLTTPGLCGWPAEQVTVLGDPRNAGQVARTLRELAREARGVLLLYYVGHGKLTVRGQLCLAVADSVADAPDYTGIAYSWLAQALRESPARTKITILDCCFSGQAIEALAADSIGGLADLTHVAGAYTLTATTRNQPAHVPPLADQHGTLTSFTGQLLGLLREGIPDGPAYLTFADLFPQLRSRLAATGLPLPHQRGTDTADRYPFARNLALPTGLPAVGAASARTSPPQDLHTTRGRPSPPRLLNRRAVVAAATTAAAAGVAGLLIPPWLDQRRRGTSPSGAPSGQVSTVPSTMATAAAPATPASSPRATTFISDLHVTALAIGQLGDMAIAVTGSADNTVRMWNLKTLEQHGETMKGTHQPFLSGAFNFIEAAAIGQLDGKTICVSIGLYDIVVWDLETCRRLGKTIGIKPDNGFNFGVKVAQFGERTVAVCESHGPSIDVWDLGTRERYGARLTGLSGSDVAAVAVGQLDGQAIVAASDSDGGLAVWDLESGQQRGDLLKGHTGRINSIAIGQLDGEAIAVSGSDDGTVRVWDLDTGRQRGEPLKSHLRPVYWVGIGQLEGRPIAAFIDDGNAMRVWDLRSGRQRGKTLQDRLPVFQGIAALGRLEDRTVVLVTSRSEREGGPRATRLWDLGPA